MWLCNCTTTGCFCTPWCSSGRQLLEGPAIQGSCCSAWGWLQRLRQPLWTLDMLSHLFMGVQEAVKSLIQCHHHSKQCHRHDVETLGASFSHLQAVSKSAALIQQHSLIVNPDGTGADAGPRPPLMSTLCQLCFQMQDASRQDQQAALYNSTCVHASFGDLELAQMTLRGVVTAPDVSCWASALACMATARGQYARDASAAACSASQFAGTGAGHAETRTTER